MFILSFPWSLVSVMRAIPIFSDCRRFSRLGNFPFMPFILMVAMVRVLFFLILFLLFPCFCVRGALMFSVVFCPIVMALFSCGLCWVWFFSILATATATGLLFSATFFFSLLVFISFGGSLGWYIFFVVGPNVILLSVLLLQFVSFYLYFLAFFNISIAESISSDVTRSLRLLRSGLCDGSLLLLSSSYDLWELWCLDEV